MRRGRQPWGLAVHDEAIGQQRQIEGAAVERNEAGGSIEHVGQRVQHRPLLALTAHEKLAHDEGWSRGADSLAVRGRGRRFEGADANHEGIRAGAAAKPAGFRVQERRAGEIEVLQVCFGIESSQRLHRLTEAGGQRIATAQRFAGVDHLAHKARPVRRFHDTAWHQVFHAVIGRGRTRFGARCEMRHAAADA